MDLFNFLRVLYKRKWLVLTATLVAGLTAYLISDSTQKTYKATAQLTTGIADQQDFAKTDDPSQALWEAEGKIKSLIDQLQSPEVLHLLSYRLVLHDLKSGEAFRQHASLTEKYSSQELELVKHRLQLKLDSLQPLLSSQKGDREHLSLMRLMRYDYPSLLKALSIERQAGTQFIKVNFKTEHPELSAFAVNNLCQDFIDFHARNQNMNAADSVRYLERMVTQKQAALEKRETALKAFASRQESIIPIDSVAGENIVARTAQLELKLETERQNIATIEARIVALDERLNGNAESFLIATRSQDDRDTEILELTARLRKLNDQSIEAQHGDQTILDSIQLVKNQLEKKITGDSPVNSNNSAQARKKIGEEKKEYERAKTTAETAVQTMEAELGILHKQARSMTSGTVSDESSEQYEREVNVARDALLLAQSQLERARRTALSKGDSTSNSATLLTQIEAAAPPRSAEPSQAWLMALGSGIAALSISMLALFVLEYMDTSIKLPSRFEGLTHLPLLSPLNQLEGTNLDLVGLFARNSTDPRQEMYKQLMRKIRFDVMAADPGVLLISSTREGAGKTSVAVSLAYSLSLNKQKVVIVDMNLKNNSLTQLTGAQPTLERYLSRQMEGESPVSSTGLDGLDIVGCAGADQSPSELFSDKNMKRFLDELRESYDCVILEGPSLNQYADSWELAKFADKVLPVFNALDDIRQADRSSIAFLRGLGDRLMGSVLNKVELTNAEL